MASKYDSIRTTITIHTDSESHNHINAILFRDNDFDVLAIGEIKIIIRDEETLDAIFEAIAEIRDHQIETKSLSTAYSVSRTNR